MPSRRSLLLHEGRLHAGAGDLGGLPLGTRADLLDVVVDVGAAEVRVLAREDPSVHVLGPPPLAGELGGLVLHQPARVRAAVGLGVLVDRAIERGVVDLDGLVGAGADADLGEPRGVDADAVGRQDAGLDAVAQADVELHDGVARVDAPQAAVAADAGGRSLVAAVAEVFVAGQPGPSRRRRRAADRAARQAGRGRRRCR